MACGAWAQWFEGLPMKHTSVFTNQSTFLARAVLAGVGIALMPTYMVLANPEFIPLDLSIQFPLDLFASYHRERAGLLAGKLQMERMARPRRFSESGPLRRSGNRTCGQKKQSQNQRESNRGKSVTATQR